MTKTFNVVIFIDSSLPQHQSYINKQVLAIQKEFPDLAIEIENENSPLLLRHARHPNRVPCYMVFKNGVYKDCKHAKLSDAQALNWIKLTTS